MQHRILIGINTQVGKMMLIFRPALRNECRPEDKYSWSAKLAITSNGEHWVFNNVHNSMSEVMCKIAPILTLCNTVNASNLCIKNLKIPKW